MDEKVEPAGSTFFWSFALLLLLAPLYKAGNRPLPLLLIELVAIGVMVALAARGALRLTWLRLPRPLLAAIGVMLVYPLVQLLPLPDAIWSAIPGHAPYASILERFAAPGASVANRAISVIPTATEYGWLALLPPLACLLVVQWLAPAQVVRLLVLLAMFAGAEALLGLVQVGMGGESIFYLRNDQAHGTATGTFVNRNHFACLLTMSLACGAALVLAEIERRPPPAGRGWWQRWLGAEGGSSIALGVCVALGLAGLLLSSSRAGIFIGLSGLTLTVALARGTLERRTRTLVLLLLVAAALVPLLRLGSGPLIERYRATAENLLPGSRTTVWADTLRIAADFPLSGCGFGSFGATYPLYRSPSVRVFYAHAHNDLLQALAEGGVAGLAGLLLVALPLGPALSGALSRRKGTLGIGCAAGLLAILLHGLVDFNFHIPANAATAAALAGVVLGLPWLRRS
jgi:O-antigen ligase